jgi:Family of unknown function (DUF6152)
MNVHRMLLAAALALPVAALAHHGWGEYDASQALKLTGTIVASSYEHPHGSIKLRTSTKTWDAVLAPPSRMDTRGLAKDMLKVGTEATVEGYPNKSKPDEMRAERITVAGKTVELR